MSTCLLPFLICRYILSR